MSRVFISFLWHFHQPYYKDLIENFYILPYTRVHLVKNYYMMAKITEMVKINLNFNFTPILLEQINDYEKNSAKDLFTNLIEYDKDYLFENKEILIEKIKKLIPKNFISKYYRLKEIINKDSNEYNFNDFIDLIFYLNLSLILNFEIDEKIEKILKKEKDFSFDEIYILYEKQNEIIKKVLPLYRELHKENLIELTMSPYAHPISPLIVDTEIAKRCSEKNLPERFSHPEDLIGQIEFGKEIFFKNFNFYPNGIWPSEGAVSQEVIEIFAESGFRYFMTDEDILFKTINKKERENLYNLYYLEIKNNKIYSLFRDKILSDSIGFIYSQMDEKDAVKDFINKLNEIKKYTNDDKFVLVLLDGENAWDYYKNNGIDFLFSLYSELKKDKEVILSRISDVIEELNSKKLNNIETGSWINGDFKTWIGEEEDNLSWNYLKIVRDDYEKLDQNKKENLKKILYILEGSDWNWWYGKTYDYNIKKDFDYLYRKHLISFYILAKIKVKDEFFKSLIIDEKQKIPLNVKNYIKPIIDGKINNFFEWSDGFYFDKEEKLTSIYFFNKIIEFVIGGFDLDNFYIGVKINNNLKEYRLILNFEGKERNYKIILNKDKNIFNLEGDIMDIEWSYFDIFEAKIPLFDEIFKEDKIINLFLLVEFNNKILSKSPPNGIFEINLDPNYLKSQWEV